MKHKIKDIMISYENLQVKVGNKWYYMKVKKLIGAIVSGKIIKKRTRTWLE